MMLLSLTVKNFKICQHLVKLWARVGCPVFFDSRGILSAKSYGVKAGVHQNVFDIWAALKPAWELMTFSQTFCLKMGQPFLIPLLA